MGSEAEPGTPLANRWWWFEPTHAAEKSEAALAWETCRRTKACRALWHKCRREAAIFQSQTSTEAEGYRLMDLFQRIKQAAPEPFFSFLMHNFDPALDWLQLSEEQRMMAKGCVIGEKEILRTNPEHTLPRQTASDPDILTLGLCQIVKSSAGGLTVRKTDPGWQNVATATQLQNLKQLQALQPETPARYLYVYFDTRVCSKTLLDALGREEQFWKPEHDLQFRLKSSRVHVIPSEQPPFAIFLTPATCDLPYLRAAFHTQLKQPRRRGWLHQCVKHWNTLSVTVPELVRDPDGMVLLDAKGFPVRRTVCRPLFDPKKHLEQKGIPTKSARRVDLWLGLAADDLARGQGLGAKALLVGRLIEQTKRWPELQNVPADCRRKKCLQELRNHQKSARSRLNEIDISVGRLDKALGDKLKKSAMLARFGVFAAASRRPP